MRSVLDDTACLVSEARVRVWDRHMLTMLNETTAYWEFFRLTDNLPPKSLAMPNRLNLAATDRVYIHR